MRKPAFCICENKGADQLISAFVFAAYILLRFYFLNPKLQASSHLLLLYSPVCIGPGRKSRRQFFFRDAVPYGEMLVSHLPVLLSIADKICT